MCVQAKRVTVLCVQLAVLRDPDAIHCFPGYSICLKVPLYNCPDSIVTPIEPQPTATDMDRERFSLDFFLEMHRSTHREYDVDQVSPVTHLCDDGGARAEVSWWMRRESWSGPVVITTHHQASSEKVHLLNGVSV